jgi:hypothetical protein
MTTEREFPFLSEDQNPIVTAVVDIYDDVTEAERQIAFVGSLSNRFRQNITDAQLKAILDSRTIRSNGKFPASLTKILMTTDCKNLLASYAKAERWRGFSPRLSLARITLPIIHSISSARLLPKLPTTFYWPLNGT